MSVFGAAPPREPIPRLDQLDLVLVTPRLRLVPIGAQHVDDLWPIASNPELPRMMSWHAHTERKQTEEFVRAVSGELANNAGVTWAIEHDDRAAGVIGLDGVAFAFRAWRIDRAEIGYWLAPALHGQGLMTEAARAVMRCAFEQIGLHKLTIGCFAENVGSRRVIEKLGFRATGRLEDDVWRDGRWWSALRYELTAAEWSDVTTTRRVNKLPPA